MILILKGLKFSLTLLKEKDEKRFTDSFDVTKWSKTPVLGHVYKVRIIFLLHQKFIIWNINVKIWSKISFCVLEIALSHKFFIALSYGNSSYGINWHYALIHNKKTFEHEHTETPDTHTYFKYEQNVRD